MAKQWTGFKPGKWQEEINVRDFIQTNYTYYDGDDSFLEGISENTQILWDRCMELLKEEVKVRVLDIEMDAISGINNFKPGYINKDHEEIVGLQTDAPLKRIINPYEGIRLVESILDIYGRELDPKVSEFFNNYAKTHNQGVFDAYTPEIRRARTTGLITG
ncbi:MAG TPA: pyruvate formate lyase family protein, partial [Erysipelothrix sp.]|nr:pyruvate formate lyase family protein [Erysipelothrix sp.]